MEFESVSKLTEYIGRLFTKDSNLTRLTVKGELSGVKLYKSGHLYFTLKEGDVIISAVMFGAANKLKFKPEDGMEVVISGDVKIYPNQGRYQLYATAMEISGQGALRAQLIALYKKLRAEGIFNPETKRPIPRYGFRVGIVTSKSSAALQDMLRVINQRCPFAKVVVAHSAVQGIEAPEQLVQGLNAINLYKDVDVIIVGRGGGSAEDLMAFNDETLARAIKASPIPVISAVGHETDNSMSDFAADLRAATPTQAAQIAVPDYAELKEQVQDFGERILNAATRSIQFKTETLDRLTSRPLWESPEEVIKPLRDKSELQFQRFQKAVEQASVAANHKLALLAGKLDNLSPLKTLARGYSITLDQHNHPVDDVTQLHAGDLVFIKFSNGQARAEIKEALADVV